MSKDTCQLHTQPPAEHEAPALVNQPNRKTCIQTRCALVIPQRQVVCAHVDDDWQDRRRRKARSCASFLRLATRGKKKKKNPPPCLAINFFGGLVSSCHRRCLPATYKSNLPTLIPRPLMPRSPSPCIITLFMYQCNAAASNCVVSWCRKSERPKLAHTPICGCRQ